MKIFVINGHKKYPYSLGKLNQYLFDLIIDICSKDNEVKTSIIENGYEIQEEIEKYKWADFIIFQSPINWYSIPWSFKKYIDEVYKSGEFYASNEKYGNGGKLINKKYMLSLTSSAKESEYSSTKGFFNIRSIDDVFLPFHKTQEYCGMQKLKTFVLYNIFNNLDKDNIQLNLTNHLNDILKSD